MLRTSRTLRRSLLLPIGLVVALAGAGCGGSDSSSGSDEGASSSDRDAARVKFTRCLRENGVDVPDNPGASGRRELGNVDQSTLRDAMEACRELQQGAFGDITDERREEFQDAFTRFSACMRERGVDVPDPTTGGGPPLGGSQLDQDDPKVKAATDACQDKLPQGGAGRGADGN